MAELREPFEAVATEAEPDPDSWVQLERRRRWTARNRKDPNARHSQRVHGA